MSDLGIPISELKDIANEFGNGDIGNVVNLSDVAGDDFGMGLLSNMRMDGPASHTVNVIAPPPLSNDIHITPLESLDMNMMDIPLSGNVGEIGGAPTFSIHRDNGGSLFENQQSSSSMNMGMGSSPTIRDPEEEKKEKIDLINKLGRLEKKGFPVSRKFTLDNSLDEIKTEFDRLVDARQLENSIKFQRQMMMGLVTGLEMMNEKINPLDWKLDGWSESVHENVEDFDEVFEELYDKYKGKGNTPPEARLLFMLAGSGFMFHMSNSFFRKQAPSMDDIFAQNPALRAQFATAAASAAGPGFGNFMNMAMNGGNGNGGGGGGNSNGNMGGSPFQAPGGPGGMFSGASAAPAQMRSPVPPQTAVPLATMPQSAAAAEPPRFARKEMKGPSNVDDILNTFREVRSAEVEFGMMGPGMAPGGPGGFAGGAGPGGIFNMPSSAAVAEIQSLHSDDLRSQAESQYTSGTRGGAQRKRKAVPVGNTVTLNV
jgi:hypothetical protein